MATETKQPFDKSTEERREAFVRNRFGEPTVFDMHDIETWLPLQRQAGRPEPAWEQFCARAFMAMCAATSPITHLRERATGGRMIPGEPLPRRIFPKGWVDRDPIFEALLSGSLTEDVFLGHEIGCAIIMRDRKIAATYLYTIREGAQGGLVFENGSEPSGGTARMARVILDVLFAEWDRQRPRWREAREFLCNALGEEIRRERAKAETDFDTAVAVSPDGTKIVHADWVVVTGLGTLTHGSAYYDEEVRQRCLVFRGEAFRERKIKRGERIQRRNEPMDLSPVALMGGDPDFAARPLPEQVVKVLRSHWGFLSNWSVEDVQWLGTINRLFDGNWERLLPEARVFTTHASLCPSPLPDGGVEVTV